MKNKKILAVELPIPEGEGWKLEAIVTDIGGEKHLIADLYENDEKRARYALTDKDYCKYIAFKNYKPSRAGKYDCYLRENYTEARVDNVYISKNTKKELKKFGIVSEKSKGYSWKNEYDALHDKMNELSVEHSCNARERKILEMNDYIDNTPEAPEDFEQWCINNMQHGGVILYKRIKPHYSEYHCCRCNYEWGMFNNQYRDMFDGLKHGKIPRKDDYEECPNCGYHGKLDQWGRFKWDITTKAYYLYQNIENGIVIRYFELKRQQSKDDEWSFSLREKIRLYLEPGKVRKYYRQYSGDGWLTTNYSGTYAITRWMEGHMQAEIM